MSTNDTVAGSSTMASLARDGARRHTGEVAARHRAGDDWVDVSYEELGDRVHDLAVGLIDLGIAVGDRVCVLADTSYEWTAVNLAISAVGAIVVPIYPTNSPHECEWVLSDSGAVAVVCQDESSLAKVTAVRAQLPDLVHTLVIHGEVDGAENLDAVAARGRDLDDAELGERIDAVELSDAYLIIYTSGTTGQPKGVVLTHGGFAAGRKIITDLGLLGHGDVVYLYLPLAHVFAQVVQAGLLEVGGTICYFGGDTSEIITELAAVRPTVFPSVPRIFEKIYSIATGSVSSDEEQERFDRAVEVGVRVQEARHRGEDVSAEDEEVMAAADERMFDLVRSLFGGRMRFAISGAAPIAPEIVRFFYAAGAPVFEGWGMTETSSLGTVNLPDAFRFGTIGKAQPGVEISIAGDAEILMRGPVVFREYWNNPEATAEAIDDDGWLHTGDLGSEDDDGYFTITGRKKDIIITAGGKNLTPSNIEGELRMSPWISHAVMYGDRRPYPVALITIDEEAIVPWAEKEGLPTDIPSLAKNDRVRAMIQEDIDSVNEHHAKVGQIKRFVILDSDFSQDTGELTPTLKIKRNVVYENFADDIDELYS